MRFSIYISGISLLIFSNFVFSQDLDSLENLLKNTSLSPEKKAALLLTIADVYDQQENYEQAVHFFSKALEQYRVLNDQDQVANLLNKLGKNYSFAGDDTKALECFREVLSLEDQVSDASFIGDAMHNIGIVYEYETKSDSSFYYYRKALELREKIGDTTYMASSLRAMGEILRGLDRMGEALAYCRQALSYKNQIKEKRILANVYNEIGYLHELNGNLDSALFYYQNLTKLCREIGLKRGEAVGLANEAVIYEKRKQFDKALGNHFLALDIDEEISYGFGIMKDYFLIASTCKQLKNYRTALNYLGKSDSLCTSKWSMDYQEIQELYYQIYKEAGDFKKSLVHHELFMQIKDSISNSEVKSKIAQLHTEYQTEKKEQEIEYLNAQNELKSQRIKLFYVLLGSLILLTALGLFIVILVIRQKNIRLKSMRMELRNFLLEVDELKSAVDNKSEWEHNKIMELLQKYEITDREADVLHMISQGHSNNEIANKLFISVNTVKYHIKNLYLKLDAKNRVEIINRFSPKEISALP